MTNTNSGSASLIGTLPPLPMSRKDAKARGLKVYQLGITCTIDGTRERLTSTGRCVACKTRADATVARAVERRIDAKREGIKARALATARRQLEAEAEKERRAAARAAEAAARLAAQKVEAAARRKADRAANKLAEAQAAAAANARAEDPEEERWSAEDDDRAPWE